MENLGGGDWTTQITSNLTKIDNQAIEQLAQSLDGKARTFGQVVAVLGASLTNTDTGVRHNAVRVVVVLLENLSTSALSRQEIDVVAQFILARLTDHQMLVGLTLRGLQALVGMREFDELLAVDIVQALGDVDTSVLGKSDRQTAYLLVERLLYSNSAVLEAQLGSRVLAVFLHLTHDESDPRNLAVAFRTLAKVLHRLPIEPYLQSAVETVSDYYPIDFAPDNQEDMQSNLKDALDQGLRSCLISSPSFIRATLPLIVEKLNSDSLKAKEESLRVLIEWLRVRQPEDAVTLTEYTTSLYNALRREIIAPTSGSTEQAALLVLTALTEATNSDSDSLVELIIADADKLLAQADYDMQYGVGKLLKAVGLGSPMACQRMFNHFMPVLIKLFMTQTRTEHRLALMNIMTSLLSAASKSRPFHVAEKTSITAFFQSLLHDQPQSMMTCQAIIGLSEMLTIWTDKGPFLELDLVTQICDAMMGAIMTQENAGVVDEVVSFFRVVGREVPVEHLYTHIVPQLMQQIQAREVLPLPTRLVKLATAILQTHRPKRSAEFVRSLYSRLMFLDQNGPYVPTMSMYLEIIAVFVDQTSSCEEAEQLYDMILFPTLKQAILAATGESVSGFQDTGVLQWLCRIYRSIVSRLTSATYTTLIGKLDRMFLRGDTSYRRITGAGDKLLPNAFKPLEKPYITTHTRCIALMVSIICSAPVGFVFEHAEWSVEFERLIETCCFCADEQSSIYAAQCLAGIVNRVDDDAALHQFLQGIRDEAAHSKARHQERRFLRIIIWITKALAMRSGRDEWWRELIPKIVRQLKHQKSGEEAADGVRVILEDSPFVLNAQMNARIDPLYRQRFFVVVLPLLLDSFGSLAADSQPWLRRNHLIALSHLFRLTPSAVVKPTIPQVVPFLVQSLASDEIGLLTSTLATFDELIVDTTPLGALPFDAQYIPPLIDRLVDLAVGTLAMEVRLAAIECLCRLSEHFPAEHLLPFKRSILKRLVKCLDDRKRRVRDVAVAARASWFLVGTASVELHA